MSAAPALFIVEHHIQDKEKWGEFFGNSIGALVEKSPEDAASDDFWHGNKCLFTASSIDGNTALCIWQLPAGATKADCEEFIDVFTGRDPSVVKNVTYPIEGSMGAQNLSFETYIKDLQRLGKEGSSQGSADDGELFFVHHDIPDKATWDAFFSDKVEVLKGKSTSKDITDAWQVGDGRKAVMWCGLGDNDAMCLWSLPKDSSETDFQEMIDKSVGNASKNNVFKIDPSNCIGGCVVHPDFYAQEAIAYVNSV